MENTSKRRGFNPIVAFILGFLLGIIFLIGSVVAAVFIALNYKLDKIDANKNEDGTYIYVNADPEKGGAENVLDLVSKITELASSGDELSLEKVSTLFPIADSLTSGLIDSLGQYIDLTYNQLKTVAFNEMGTFFQEKVMDVRPASLLGLLGGGDFGGGEVGDLIDVLLNGSEALYVEHEGNKYPVYFDIYDLKGDRYEREDGTKLGSQHEEYLLQKNGKYVLYFFNVNGACFITYRDDDGNFVYTTTSYHNYDKEISTLTGTYYLDSDGERVGPYVTIRSFTDGSAFNSLNGIYVTDLFGGDSELTDKILGELTLGDVLSGVDFDGIINSLEISAFVDIDPTNNLMLYLAYGITGVFDDGCGNYTGSYTLDGNKVTCYLVTEPADTTESGLKVTKVYYTDEEDKEQKVPSTAVNELNDRLQHLTEELALSDLMNIVAPTEENKNTIMLFLAFSVADVKAEEGDGYSFIGKYYPPEEEDSDKEGIDCYLVASADGKYITDVYYIDKDGKRKSVDKTSIAGVSKQVNRLTKTLKLKYIIDVGENKVMAKLGEYTISTVQNAIDELTLGDFIEEVSVPNGNNDTAAVILSYIVYGITDIKAEAGEGYTHTGKYHTVEADGLTDKEVDCFIKTEGGKITEVYYMVGEEKKLAGTTVKSVSARIEGVTTDITLGQLIDVKGNKILTALSDSTIKSLSGDINTLALNQLYADSVYAPSAVDEKGESIKNYVAKPYLAVSGEKPEEASEYSADYVYYTKDGENFVLASTTGKLTQKEYDDRDDLYTLCEGENLRILFNASYLYYTKDEKGKLKLVNTEDDFIDNDGKVDEFEEKLYTYGAANAMWKLLLCDTNKSEKAYSVNNLTSMVNNVTANTQNTSMRELHEAGIMTFKNPNDLNTKVIKDGTETTVGALTLEEMISYSVELMKNLNKSVITG